MVLDTTQLKQSKGVLFLIESIPLSLFFRVFLFDGPVSHCFLLLIYLFSAFYMISEVKMNTWKQLPRSRQDGHMKPVQIIWWQLLCVFLFCFLCVCVCVYV